MDLILSKQERRKAIKDKKDNPFGRSEETYTEENFEYSTDLAEVQIEAGNKGARKLADTRDNQLWRTPSGAPKPLPVSDENVGSRSEVGCHERKSVMEDSIGSS